VQDEEAFERRFRRDQTLSYCRRGCQQFLDDEVQAEQASKLVATDPQTRRILLEFCAESSLCGVTFLQDLYKQKDDLGDPPPVKRWGSRS